MTATQSDDDLVAPETEPPRPAPARPSILAVRAIVFVVGAASLGTEIAAARLLAPYFGASTIIWANTIATILIALSVGYAVGGRLADRRGDLRGLCAIVMIAGVLLAVVPFAGDPFLKLSVKELGALSVGGFLGSLVGVLALVAVPVLLLGCVAPYANRLAIADVAETGTVTGRLYAISTAGSLVGTFAAALLLIPVIGTHRTFLVFALALAVVAAVAVTSWRWLVVPGAIAGLIALPPPAIGSDVPGGRVIFSADTQYQYARVVQFRDGVRWLQLNEGVVIHSLYRPWSYLTGGYWDDFLVLPLAGERGVPHRIAILGDAAGTIARAYGHYFPRTRVDAVELDGELTTIGKRYFDLRGPNLHLYTADARPWLAASKAHYDAIFLDVYRQPYIPFYLVTKQFFASMRAHLRPGGVAIVNVGQIPGSDALEKVVTATLRADFPYVLRDRLSDSTTLVEASMRPLSAARLIEAAARARGQDTAGAAAAKLPVGLAPLADEVAARMGPGLKGGTVYTDDRAPVEWLTDLSILRYALGKR